jgi:hypothetical protein
MSSVPVQFLIYVMPEPNCTQKPVIQPLADCLEASVGVTKTFTLTILNMCDPTAVDIADIVAWKDITGMQKFNLTVALTNQSLTYASFTWTPQSNQLGPQQLCTVAYTE